jgi:hypothetical protein
MPFRNQQKQRKHDFLESLFIIIIIIIIIISLKGLMRVKFLQETHVLQGKIGRLGCQMTNRIVNTSNEEEEGEAYFREKLLCKHAIPIVSPN